MDQSYKLQLLLGLFITMLLLSNFLGIKVVPILGVNTSIGVLFVPVMFLITDIVSDVKGRVEANRFVTIAIICLLVVLGATWLALAWPASDRFTLVSQFNDIFGLSVRFLIASVVAFVVSQYNDVLVFHVLKEKTAGKMLWLRNNVSTMFSQAIDTLLFMFIAFYGVAGFTVPFILELSASYYLVKIIFAALDTPFVYAGASWLRK